MFQIVFKDWNKFEKVWLFAFLTVIIATTIYFSATGMDYSSLGNIMLNWVVSPISAVTGIFCVVLAAKGKLSNWTYGIVNSVLYGYLAYRSGYYGDAIINIVYFLPTQFIGLAFWRKQLKPESNTDVKMRKLTIKQFMLIIFVGIVSAVLFGIFLHYYLASVKYLDIVYAT